jgi:hypothetical protein
VYPPHVRLSRGSSSLRLELFFGQLEAFAG